MTTTPQEPAPDDAADRAILDDRAEAEAIKARADDASTQD